MEKREETVLDFKRFRRTPNKRRRRECCCPWPFLCRMPDQDRTYHNFKFIGYLLNLLTNGFSNHKITLTISGSAHTRGGGQTYVITWNSTALIWIEITKGGVMNSNSQEDSSQKEKFAPASAKWSCLLCSNSQCTTLFTANRPSSFSPAQKTEHDKRPLSTPFWRGKGEKRKVISRGANSNRYLLREE